MVFTTYPLISFSHCSKGFGKNWLYLVVSVCTDQHVANAPNGGFVHPYRRGQRAKFFANQKVATGKSQGRQRLSHQPISHPAAARFSRARAHPDDCDSPSKFRRPE